MARVLTAEQFKSCPRGTVFAYGQKWNFSSLWILDGIVEGRSHDGRPFWGFWAANPMWVDPEDGAVEDDNRLDRMAETGESHPADTSLYRHMSYDSPDPRDMEVFFVLERSDWDRINEMVRFPDDPM